jgi:hypothetical protein|tara:strand:- start:1183 stop:1383 length:201 start_codon:yes stop_codon:yes gene_type:complete
LQSNEDSIKQRMAELCEPIDKQIMMCDNKNDILMLGCAMLEKVKNILDSQIGVEGRKIILKEANDR